MGTPKSADGPVKGAITPIRTLGQTTSVACVCAIATVALQLSKLAASRRSPVRIIFG